MREGEVARPVDLLLTEVDVIDRQKVRVDIVLMVQDPDDLINALGQTCGPGQRAFPPLISAFPKVIFWAISMIFSIFASSSDGHSSNAV